jgi:hypothetical protein
VIGRTASRLTPGCPLPIPSDSSEEIALTGEGQ